MTDDPSDDTSLDESEDAVSTEDEEVGEHLQDIKDGIGCTEIWEHLSENRSSDA